MNLSFTKQPNLEDGTVKSPDVASGESWQWFGSVCQREPPEEPEPMTGDGNLYGPWADDCQNPRSPREDIGTIGWLLSCRQNYAETIDLLYSTNTIAMSGEEMMTHINQLLLPQRLASITSLEIRWPLEKVVPAEPEDDTRPYYEQMRDPYHMNEDQFSVILDTLSPEQFPSLRRVFISFEKEMPTQDIANPQGHNFIIRKFH
ncbi:hypothetical protein FSARC_9649 [Fusarium sarcochroum]|uniref:DUF7730 domain-containing protein n=1 Tax=Fusarium sarcochroum TaxID=1208366 RepID=A0A8H4TQH8_9HYPO|nr:hypothetical protein FSARC_9649 [Fusarium sarcochroum]